VTCAIGPPAREETSQPAHAATGAGSSPRTWMLAGPHSMKFASLRSLMRCKLLCTCLSVKVSSCKLRAIPPAAAHLRGVHLPLDDVEDGDVLALVEVFAASVR